MIKGTSDGCPKHSPPLMGGRGCVLWRSGLCQVALPTPGLRPSSVPGCLSAALATGLRVTAGRLCYLLATSPGPRLLKMAPWTPCVRPPPTVPHGQQLFPWYSGGRGLGPLLLGLCGPVSPWSLLSTAALGTVQEIRFHASAVKDICIIFHLYHLKIFLL